MKCSLIRKENKIENHLLKQLIRRGKYQGAIVNNLKYMRLLQINVDLIMKEYKSINRVLCNQKRKNRENSEMLMLRLLIGKIRKLIRKLISNNMSREDLRREI